MEKQKRYDVVLSLGKIVIALYCKVRQMSRSEMAIKGLSEKKNGASILRKLKD